MTRRSRRVTTSKTLPSGPVQAMYQPFGILSEDQVEAIHLASLRVLQETGVEIMSPQARRLFVSAGAELDVSNDRIRLAPELVENTIKTCPSSWMMRWKWHGLRGA